MIYLSNQPRKVDSFQNTKNVLTKGSYLVITLKVLTIAPIIFALLKDAYEAATRPKQELSASQHILNQVKQHIDSGKKALINFVINHQTEIITTIATVSITLIANRYLFGKSTSNPIIKQPQSETSSLRNIMDKFFDKQQRSVGRLENLPPTNTLLTENNANSSRWDFFNAAGYFTSAAVILGAAAHYFRPAFKKFRAKITSLTDSYKPDQKKANEPWFKRDPTQIFGVANTKIGNFHQASQEMFPNSSQGVQTCASNALAFLNMAFDRRLNLDELEREDLDKLLIDGLPADISVRDKAKIANPNQGLTIEELLNYHSTEETSFKNIQFPSAANILGVKYVAQKGQEIDFKDLFENTSSHLGVLITKGGQTFALYKNGNDYYFYNSHGTPTAKNQSNQGAYIVKSNDINDLLNRIGDGYFSSIPDDAEEYSHLRQIDFYQFDPKKEAPHQQIEMPAPPAAVRVSLK